MGLAVLFAIIEAATLGLATIWFAIGALIGLFASLLNLSPWMQVILFLVSSTILLYYTRPIAKKYLKLGSQKTNVDSMIGREGIVTKVIGKYNTGQVKVWGQVWTAVSKDSEEIFEDTPIIVEAVEGVKLIVRLKEES